MTRNFIGNVKFCLIVWISCYTVCILGLCACTPYAVGKMFIDFSSCDSGTVEMNHMEYYNNQQFSVVNHELINTKETILQKKILHW